MTDENLGIASLLSKIPLASRTDEENRQSPTELNKSVRSKNSSRVSTAKKTKDEEPTDFNNEEIQRKMSGVISDLSPTNEAEQTKTMTDESESFVRPQSFTLEQTKSIDGTSEDENFNSKPTTTIANDDIRSSSRQSNTNGLDETRRFGVVSPKAPSSVRQSPRPAEKSSRAPSRLSHNSTVVEQNSARSSARQSPIVTQSRKSSSKDDFLTTDKIENETDRSQLIKPGEQLRIPDDNERIHSPPPSSTSGVETLTLVNPVQVNPEPINSSRRSSTTQVNKTHSRKSSQASNRQIDEKTPSSSSRRQSKEKLDTDRSAKSSKSQAATSEKSSRRATSQKELDLKLDLTPLELATESKTPTEENPSQRWVEAKEVPSLRTSDDERTPRPQSPNAQQIEEHNQITSGIKRENVKKRKSSTRKSIRGTSADSFSGIPIVDDQSIGSNSDKNTDIEKRRKRVVRSKRKDVQTNTEGVENDPDPVNVNVTVLVKNYPGEKERERTASPKDVEESHRATQSDSEQIVTEKQKKRRRPKRISRTTQTYECVFRRMAQDEHQELQPTGETEKSVQTRRSQLHPRNRSPKRPLPIYLSTDAFRIEEILPKQFPQTQRNVAKTSVVARSTSPQTGKILILRPTLPIHHADAVNVQRVCLQYAIDLMPKETNRTAGKSSPSQQLEQTNHLPSISSHRPTFKDKPVMNKTDGRRPPFGKNGGGGTV